MSKQIGAAAMRELAEILKEQLHDLGFALIVFEFGDNVSMSNYISNGERPDMIKALKETIKRLEGGDDFMTPEEN